MLCAYLGLRGRARKNPPERVFGDKGGERGLLG
jgi:hypothetical protein